MSKLNLIFTFLSVVALVSMSFLLLPPKSVEQKLPLASTTGVLTAANYCVISPPYTYQTDSEINIIATQIMGQDPQQQLNLISAFIKQSPKFFSSAQMVLLLSLITSDSDPNSVFKNQALLLFVPYIPKMLSAEVKQILASKVSSTLAINVLLPMVCNLSDNNSIEDIFYAMYQPGTLIQKYFKNQQDRVYSTGPFLTTQGTFGAFLYQTTDSMFFPITLSNGSQTTRFEIFKKFYNTYFGDLAAMLDRQQSCTYASGVTCNDLQFAHGYDPMSQLINTKTSGDGDVALFSYALSQIQFVNQGTLTDIFIFTDGYHQGLVAGNSNKVRVNTFSLLIGGSESQSDRDKVTQTLQSLAYSTNGTFMQIPEIF